MNNKDFAYDVFKRVKESIVLEIFEKLIKKQCYCKQRLHAVHKIEGLEYILVCKVCGFKSKHHITFNDNEELYFDYINFIRGNDEIQEEIVIEVKRNEML